MRTERPRVLLIVPRFGSINRGVEVFTAELTSRVDKRRVGITVLSAPHDQSVEGVRLLQRRTILRERTERAFANPVVAAVARRVGIAGETDLETLVLMASSLADAWSERYDVVLPLGGRWSYLYAAIHRRRGAKVVSVGQGGPSPFALHASDIFVGLTPSAIEEASRLHPGIPTRLIPNGVDLGLFKPPPLRPPAPEKVILSVGALNRDKRHDLLLDAAMQLPDTVSVCCVGDGPERAALTAHPLCKAGRLGFAKFRHADMPSCYREADLFSLASPNEAFGIVFLEALASGLNVVTHDAPRQRFVVGDVGFYCNVYDTSSYAAALHSAMLATDKARNIAHATSFRWDRIIRQYEDLFRELCA